MSKKFHLSCLVTSITLIKKIGEDENKIPDSTGLVKKTVYNAEISDIEEEYFTSSDYNKFPNEITETKTLVDNSCTSNLIKFFDSNTKLATSATKVELKTIKDKILKLLAFGLSYLSDKSRFKDDGTQNCLLFHPIYRYF